MVCLPCIILPVVLAIYLKFIQPFILRFLPERWVNFLDPILYPTCPAKPPAPFADKKEATSDEKPSEQSCCAGGDESKKDL